MATQNQQPDTVLALTSAELHTIQTFYGVWNNNQLDLLDEIRTPDWKDIPLGPGQADGPQGLKDIITYFRSVLPDVAINILEIFGSHGRAGVRAQITFTHTNTIMGIPATGKKAAIALHEFHYLKDGKLTHTWHLEDWFSLLTQSVVWPPQQ
jgi:predicted ester cyclase